MTYFFISVLILSISGMLLMLLIKRWELATGKVVFARARPRVARAVHTSAFVAGTVAPLVARHWGEYTLELAKLLLHRAVAWTVLHTEHVLERVLYVIKHSTTPKRRGEASEFLREVAEHKKHLQDSAQDRTPAE